MDNLKGLADAQRLWQNHFVMAKRGGSQSGRRTKSPFAAPGNHTDSPPAGGKFNKTFGVLAGLETLENYATMPALASKKVASGTFHIPLIAAGAFSVGVPFAPAAKGVSPTRQTSSV